MRPVVIGVFVFSNRSSPSVAERGGPRPVVLNQRAVGRRNGDAIAGVGDVAEVLHRVERRIRSVEQVLHRFRHAARQFVPDLRAGNGQRQGHVERFLPSRIVVRLNVAASRGGLHQIEREINPWQIGVKDYGLGQSLDAHGPCRHLHNLGYRAQSRLQFGRSHPMPGRGLVPIARFKPLVKVLVEAMRRAPDPPARDSAVYPRCW